MLIPAGIIKSILIFQRLLLVKVYKAPPLPGRSVSLPTSLEVHYPQVTLFDPFVFQRPIGLQMNKVFGSFSNCQVPIEH